MVRDHVFPAVRPRRPPAPATDSPLIRGGFGPYSISARIRCRFAVEGAAAGEYKEVSGAGVGISYSFLLPVRDFFSIPWGVGRVPWWNERTMLERRRRLGSIPCFHSRRDVNAMSLATEVWGKSQGMAKSVLRSAEFWLTAFLVFFRLL